MSPEHTCLHPYFSESASAFALLGIFVGVGLLTLGGLVWIVTRRRGATGVIVGTLVLPACYATLRWGDEFVMRSSFGTHDWERLQGELQSQEAELTRFAVANPGLTTSQLVAAFVATHTTRVFEFSDSSIPPLTFKISDWRDTVPRVVVGFGCDNNVLFNSAKMSVEQSD
jgi:hypothetical protein